MFLGRFDKFECDYCKKVEYSNNKFPKGMVYIAREHGDNGPIKHACKSCVEKDLPPKHLIRQAGEK